ncbi:hypothetical protein B0G74_7148 [Paraburkholderia sp. BL9I2N2]|nr:hypothetical protein B0G74_7148 [Paraburkholderia sp. BL9I2N2]
MTSVMAKTRMPRKALPAGIGKVLKRLHYPLDLIQLCVRWHVAYSLSLRNLEEMMAERGIEVDRSSVHRRVIKLVPLFEKAFRRHKRAVGKSWRMDEISVRRSKKGHAVRHFVCHIGPSTSLVWMLVSTASSCA